MSPRSSRISQTGRLAHFKRRSAGSSLIYPAPKVKVKVQMNMKKRRPMMTISMVTSTTGTMLSFLNPPALRLNS